MRIIVEMTDWLVVIIPEGVSTVFDCTFCGQAFDITPEFGTIEYEPNSPEPPPHLIKSVTICSPCYKALTERQIRDYLRIEYGKALMQATDLAYRVDLIAWFSKVMSEEEDSFANKENWLYLFSERLEMSQNELETAREYVDWHRGILDAPIVWPLDRSDQKRFAGYVYLLGSPEGYCKIGRTAHLTQRLLTIGLQLPFRVEILHSVKVSDPVWAERFLHRKFSHCRQNGEWFLLSKEEIEWIKSLTSLEPDA